MKGGAARSGTAHGAGAPGVCGAPDDGPSARPPGPFPAAGQGPGPAHGDGPALLPLAVRGPARRLRLTRRGRRALVALLAVLVLAAGAVAVRFVGYPDAWLPGALAGPECTVRTADGERAVDLADARRLADAALAAVSPSAVATRSAAGTRAPQPQDAAVVDAVRTRDAALSCRLPGDVRRARRSLPRQAEGASGLTPRAGAVLRALRASGGRLPVGGFAPGGVSTGHMPGSAHYEGRAIDVFFRPADAARQRHGWVVAQWLVAHAADLDVDTVIYDDRIWSASASAQGWRPYVPPQGPTSNPVLRHLDHVHVDVVRGAAPE